MFDASSIVHAWDNYPRELIVFETLWEEIGTLVQAGEISFSQVALDEVGHVSPDCRQWLDDCDVVSLPVTADILDIATQLKADLGIVNDNYHPDGVDENDLLIISTAKHHGVQLVSNEKVQNNLPGNQRKYKIPAVCQHKADVECCAFVDFLNENPDLSNG